jgi:hypothetical protein
MERPADTDFDGFSFINTLKGDDWNNYMVYLYWSPPGQRRLGPYIDVITEPVNMEWVKKKFGGSGGGRYTLWVNRNTEPIWRKTHEFEIEGNRIFQGQPVEAHNPTQPATGANSTLEGLVAKLVEILSAKDPNTQAVIDMQRKAFESTLETVAKKNPENGGGLLETVKFLKELGLLTIPGQANGGGLLDTIKTLKELGLIGASASGSDPLKTVEMVGKLLEAVKTLAPEAEPGGDWKAAAVRVAGELAPKIPGMFSDIAAAANWNAQAQDKGSQRTPPPITTQALAPQTAGNTTQTPPSKPTTTPSPSETTPEPQEASLEAYLWGRVAFMISNGADGDQIAQFLHFSTAEPADGDPGRTASIIGHFTSFTEGGLLTMLESKPEIQKALEGKDSFLIAKNFLHYCRTGELVDDDEEPEPDEPAKVPPVA